jgi:chromosome segregation ATPase
VFVSPIVGSACTERADELSVMVGSLDQQLRDKEQETKTVFADAQRTGEALAAECTRLERECVSGRDIISRREWAFEQLKSTNEQFVVQIEELKSTATDNYSLEDTILSWKAEIPRLSMLLESERQARFDEREQLQAELADERGRHAEARDEIETLSSEIDQIKYESDAVIGQWTGKFTIISIEVRWYDLAEFDSLPVVSMISVCKFDIKRLKIS